MWNVHKGLVVICKFNVHNWTLKSITHAEKAGNYLFANAVTVFVKVKVKPLRSIN